MHRMNIVMTTDKNYIVPTMVTLSSVLSSAKEDSFFSVYILCSHDLDYESRQRLKCLEQQSNRITIEFAEISDDRLNGAVTTAHIPIASYYRLYISQVISEDRCLFIDGDMIIQEDLTDVYNISMDNYLVAAVKDLGVQCNFSQYMDYADYLGIPTMDSYVNAGFMLFNLKKIRDEKLDSKMIDAIKCGFKFMDQDILNKFCYGKIKLLPLKYDFFMEYYGSFLKRGLTGYAAVELEEVEKNIAVMHFTGFFKPWLCTRLMVNQRWWNEAKRVLDRELYNKILNDAKEFEQKSDWKYILDILENEKSIVIFGFSQIAQSVVQRLLEDGIETIVAFVDNDVSKYGMGFASIPVISLSEAYRLYPDAMFLISSQNGYIQIRRQLAEMGVESKKVIRYIHKDETYYERLDERYIE